ncbi:MAG: hypothetical protein JWM16_4357 [Verrucomicrobiales bacterium]|nr:hypothetical protein [Verrucomicrobiales bacterium]
MDSLYSQHGDFGDQSGWDTQELIEQLEQTIIHGHREHGTTVGTPGSDALDWVHQTTPFTCDVVSQEMILHEFGVHVSEAQLVYDAASHGWLTDVGTSPQDMAQLLELHGVQAHSEFNGSIEALTSELAHGHKVIVAVDADELWNQGGPLFDLFHSPQANHALVITGLDMSDPNHPKAVVNDPGDPEGAGKCYPLDHFLEAWSASGNTYVATNAAPSHLSDHTVFGANFNSDLGMYMDQNFWMSFLKGLAIATTNYFVTHHYPTDAPADEINPWDNMTEATRNDLFLSI